MSNPKDSQQKTKIIVITDKYGKEYKFEVSYEEFKQYYLTMKEEYDKIQKEELIQ